MPGGSGTYLKVLREILVEAAKGRTQEQMANFIVRRYRGVVSQKAAKSYLYVTIVLGLTEIRMGLTKTTDSGDEFVRTKKSEVIAKSLIERIDGVAEILDLLSEEPMRIGLLAPAMAGRGFDWRTPSQLRYRLRWMEECNLVRRVGLARPVYFVMGDEARTSLGNRAPKSKNRSGTAKSS